jgi:TP901 family phage tail tape measure protein
MATIADMMVRIGADVRDLDRKLAGASVGVGKFGKDMDAIGSKATRNLTLPIVAGLGYSVHASNKLHKSLREVNTLTGEVGKQAEKDFAKFKSGVASLSQELGIAQEQLSRGLYDTLSAGVPKGNAIDFLRVATKASVAGVTEVQVAVDGLTTNLNAFGLEADQAGRVSDIMFATVKAGKTTFDQLSNAMFNVAPTANAMGVSIEETSGAIATLTKQGTPTSVATTQIRAALVAMMRPLPELTKAFEKLNVKGFDELLKREGSMQGAFDALYDSTGGNKEQLVKMLGSVEAVNAVLGMTGGNAKGAAADLALMKDSVGATDAAFDEMGNARGLDRLKVSVDNLAIAIGDNLMPAVEPVVAQVIALTQAFASLDPSVQQAAVQTLLLLAVMGPLLKIVGTGIRVLNGAAAGTSAFVKGLAGLNATGGKVARVVYALGYALGSIPGQLRMFVAGVRGAAAVGGPFSKAVYSLGYALGRVLGPAATIVRVALMAVGSAIAAVVGGITLAGLAIAAAVVAVIAVAVLVVVKWEWCKAKVLQAWAAMQSAGATVWAAITGAVGKAMSAVGGAVSAGVGKVTSLFAKLRALTVKDVAFAFGYVLGYVVGTMVKLAIAVGQGAVKLAKAFGDAVSKLPGIVLSAGTAIVSATVDWVQNMAASIASGARRAWSAFSGALSKLPGLAVSIGSRAYQGIVGGLKAMPGAVANLARSAANGAYNILRQIPGKVKGFMARVPGAVSAAAGAAASAAYEVGAAIVQGMVQGVKDLAGNLKDAAVGAVKGAVKGAKDAIKSNSPSKLTRDVIGVPFVQGIEVGILSRKATLAKVAGDTVLGAVNFAAEGAAAAMRSKGQAIVDAAKSALAEARKALTAAGKTATKADDKKASAALKSARQRITAGQRLVNRANAKYLADDRVSAMTDRFAATADLKRAMGSLTFAKSGRSAADLKRAMGSLTFAKSGRSAADTHAKLENDVGAAQSQYASLQAYLNKNAKKLTVASRTAIQSQMAGLLTEIADAQAAITATFEQARQEWLSAVQGNASNRDAWRSYDMAAAGATGSVADLSRQIADMQSEHAELQNFWNHNWSSMSQEMQTGVIARMAELFEGVRAVTDEIHKLQIASAANAGTWGKMWAAWSRAHGANEVAVLTEEMRNAQAELTHLTNLWHTSAGSMSDATRQTLLQAMIDTKNEVNGLSAAIVDANIAAITSTNDLTLAQLDLADALAGGATAATTAARTAALQDEYNRLEKFLKSNEATLSVAQRVQITQQLAQLANDIRSANQAAVQAATGTVGAISQWWRSDRAFGASISSNSTPVGGGGTQNNVTIEIVVQGSATQAQANEVAAGIVTALGQQGVQV